MKASLIELDSRRWALIEKSLPTVNNLLENCTAIGAYCLGAVCAFGWRDGVEVPKVILEHAVKCPSVQDAIELYSTLEAVRKR